ncbi:MAG: hypothetical protein ACXVXT_20905, partial [Blastococcus sp.]
MGGPSVGGPSGGGPSVEGPAGLGSGVVGAKLGRLRERLEGLESVLIAFSGGADSAFLLAAAVHALGERRVAAAT